jgi:hypothetical protein
MQIENDCDRELDNIDSAVSRSCPAFSQVSKCLSFSDIIPTRGGHAGPRSDTSCLGATT